MLSRSQIFKDKSNETMEAMCPSDVSQSLNQVVKQTKGFWCFLAMDRASLSSPTSFLGWDEARRGWKKSHKSCSVWNVLWFCKIDSESVFLLSPWPPETYFKSEDQFSIAILLSLFSYIINYDIPSSPQPLRCFYKDKERKWHYAYFTVRETEAQNDKTLLSHCRLDLEMRPVQTIKNQCCLIQGKV